MVLYRWRCAAVGRLSGQVAGSSAVLGYALACSLCFIWASCIGRSELCMQRDRTTSNSLPSDGSISLEVCCGGETQRAGRGKLGCSWVRLGMLTLLHMGLMYREVRTVHAARQNHLQLPAR